MLGQIKALCFSLATHLLANACRLQESQHYVKEEKTKSAEGGQFLEQPDSGTVFAPVQDQVTLTCLVEEGYVIDWHVAFANGDQAVASNKIALMVLRERGFTLEGVTTRRSRLSLRETESQTNNGTNITCATQEEGVGTSPVTSNTVQVIFYGASPPPTNLRVAENRPGYLNISWSLGFIEGVPVNYTLNLNTTSAQPIIIAGLLDQHYVFETSRPCDVYSFTVTAVTAAGSSTPSQELDFTNLICFATTIRSESPMTLPTSQTTVSSHSSSAQQPTTSSPPTQDNSVITLIIIVVSVIAAVVAMVTAVVLGNVMVCVCCCKEMRTVVKPDLTDPVYEIPGSVSPGKFAMAPFAMTSSSAYGVPMKLQEYPLKSPDVNFPPKTLPSAYC